MFKRANKITSLLVAAAAIVSIVPASAADVKKVDSQDGVVYNAVAYKGAALVDGEVNDNDGAYYLKDGKYTEIADVDSGSDYALYGSKYVNVDEGDYFVDLTTGKSTDDSMDEDDMDDAASALRKKIKDADRYGDNANIATLKIIPGNKFGETWYSTNGYTIAAGSANNGTTPSIYTDKNGAYIDADYNLGKIKVETTGASAVTGTVTVENTVDTEDLKSGNTKFATVDAKINATNNIALGQDKDNIYRYAEITIKLTPESGVTLPTNVLVNGKSFATAGNVVTLPVIQKIAKTQDSDDIDDAMYSKTVTNYVFSNDGGDLTDGNAVKYLALAKKAGTEARVIGGKLALYNVTDNLTGKDNVAVQATTLKSKNGYYYTDAEDQTTLEAEVNGDLDKTAFDTDVDGNIYVIEDGYVKKFDGTDDWTKLYKVDGSMNSISAYDKDNMITWSQEDEVYSVVGGKKAADEDKTDVTTPVVTTPVVKAGWAQAADKTWSFVKADGTKATGWLQDGSTWYYLNATGTMATGWVNDNGTWYYLAGSGAMLFNTVVDGYTLGASGAWVK